MSEPYTTIPPGEVILERDIMSGLNWPGTDKLAIWHSSVGPGWIAADRVTACTGQVYATIEEAAEAIGARLP